MLLVTLSSLRALIQRNLQAVVILFGGDTYHGIMLYSLVFLPGVMIHEMSHFFAATIMGVRTGDISFFPRKDTMEDGRIALGTVKVAKTDFVRSSLIGAAPFLVGTFILFVLVTVMFQPVVEQLATLSLFEVWNVVRGLFSNPRNWLFLYLVFTIANTMFVSREDARAFPVIIVFLMILLGVILFTGISSKVYNLLWPKVDGYLVMLSGSFLAAVLIDVVVLLGLMFFVYIIQKITKKRVIYGAS
jgi:hypothetical protein